jgi:hypothetical protein
VDPIVQTLAIAVVVSYAPSPRVRPDDLPNNFDSVELHAHSKYCLVLAVLELGVCSDDCAVVVVVHLLLVCHDELAPSLLSILALHLLLVYGCLGVEIGEVLFEVFVDFIVEFGEAQLRARHLLEDLPVCLDVLDDYTSGLVRGQHDIADGATFDSECLLDLCHH